MREIQAFDAKTHFSAILRDIEAGESFLVTRHGKPVARLLPAGEDTEEELKEARRRAFQNLQTLPKIKKPKRGTLKDMMSEGRE